MIYQRPLSRSVVLFLTLFGLMSLGQVFGQATNSDEGEDRTPDQELDAQLFDDPFADLDEAFLDPFALPDSDSLDFEDFGFDDPFLDPLNDSFGESNQPGSSSTQTSGNSRSLSSFEDLFFDDQMIDQADSDSLDSSGGGGTVRRSAIDDLLTRDELRVGGRISGGVTADWNWTEPFQGGFSFIEPDSQSLTPRLSTDLTFDARPSRDFRAFLKLRITSGGGGGVGGGLGQITQADILAASADAQDDGAGGVIITDADGNEFTIPASLIAQFNQTTAQPSIGTPPVLNIAVYEAFADFSYQDQLLFRFGKHTITWGVGYFWSPADVLNLTALNPEDPTADREGPVSLKTEYPFGIGNALTLYAIVNQGAEPLDLAVAPRIDLLLGGVDLGIGGYYQRSLAPRLISTLRFTLGQVDFFGEAVLSRGSDRVFVRPSADQSQTEEEDGPDLVLDTFEDKTSAFFSGTFGLRYLKNYDSGTSLLLLSQYFFNGIGYGSSIGGIPSTRVLPAAVDLLLGRAINGLAPQDDDPDPILPPALGVGDITNFGRHYAGLVFGLNSIAGGPVSLNLAALVNLTDLSTIFTPSISIRFLDLFTLSLNPRITFGPPGGEFTNPLGLITGDSSSWGTLGLSFGVSIPGRSF